MANGGDPTTKTLRQVAEEAYLRHTQVDGSAIVLDRLERRFREGASADFRQPAGPKKGLQPPVKFKR